ncbi:MAG: peptidase [Desulfobacteraceae bacterium 4572_130]|nr:MAG: peptidase [Desulfobacteraceae bacterium 4572_130]
MDFKRNIRFLVIVFFCFFMLLNVLANVWAEESVLMIPKSFAMLAKKAKPAVVNIRTVKVINGGGRVFNHFFQQPFGNNKDFFNDFFRPFMQQNPKDYKQKSLGSGFIISKDGYIVTNNHVIKDAEQIKVKLYNEKEYNATVIGTDSNTDLALIKINGKDFIPLEMGDSNNLEIGTWVVAIGSPFGLEQTVTAGIVSAKGRILGSGPYDDFIQTDASINPGNSGGPLLNLKGEVIGINTAIVASGQGIGFAIPSNLANGIINQLRKSGKVIRGWMGVAIQDITPELGKYYNIQEKNGVLVTKVYKGDPADRAGIQPEDIIIEINDKKIKSSRDLASLIAGFNINKEILVTLIRQGYEKKIHVKLAKKRDSDMKSYLSFGLELEEIDTLIAKKYMLPESERGLVVTNIKPNSSAASTGIKKGDLLKEINHKPVETVDQYINILEKIKKGEIVDLLFRRGNISFIVIRLTK